MITPMDIHNKEFETGFRGYSKESVDAFMDELKGDYEELYRSNREMTDRMEQLEKRIAQYEQMEATMNNTLALAKETGENVKESARKEAELIIQEATTQKQTMLEEADTTLRESREKYATIQHEIAVFKAKIESMLYAQIKMLDSIVLEDSKVETSAEVEIEAALDNQIAPSVDVVEETTPVESTDV